MGLPDGKGLVTFAKYTGQESSSRREEIIASPPDVLLTNFVMLELILTGTEERGLVEASQGLEFLVLDELHTYRGRQGADVAMLVRRVRNRCGAPTMRCVGTSATLAGIGTREERQVERRLSLGQAFQDNGLVFPDELGRPLAPYRLSHRFSSVVQAAGMAPLRFLDLRHTSATFMLGAGVHPKIVSERLGHSGVAITLGIRTLMSCRACRKRLRTCWMGTSRKVDQELVSLTAGQP